MLLLKDKKADHHFLLEKKIKRNINDLKHIQIDKSDLSPQEKTIDL